MNTANAPRYVSASELSVTFKVSLRTVAEWRKQGMPCLNANATGKRPVLRFSVDAVDRWLQARQKAPAPVSVQLRPRRTRKASPAPAPTPAELDPLAEFDPEAGLDDIDTTAELAKGKGVAV